MEGGGHVDDVRTIAPHVHKECERERAQEDRQPGPTRDVTCQRAARGHAFAVVLLVFAVLVVGGVALIAQRPWIGAAVASVGAIAAGFALFWTVAAIVLGLAIVVLSVMVARRSAATQRRLA